MNWLIKNPFAAAPTTQIQPTNQNTNIPKTPENQDPLNPIQVNMDDPANKDPVNKDAGDGGLGDFSKLWDTVPIDPTKPDLTQPQSFTPNLDQAKFNDMLSKIDFTRSVSPEQKAAILAGGEGATQALMEVLNITNRQTFATVFSANQRMVESALENAQKRFLDAVPGHVKDMMVTNALTSSNPIVKNPAYAPLVESVKTKMQEKYPKASAAEIETGVNAYFDNMVVDMNKTKDGKLNITDNQKDIRTGSPKADWEGWFDSAIKQS